MAYDLCYKAGEYATGVVADGLTAGYGGTVLDFLAEGGNARQDALREGKGKKIKSKGMRSELCIPFLHNCGHCGKQ